MPSALKDYNEIATALYYLAEAVIDHFNKHSKDASIGDWFCIGQDEFVYNLYPYAEIIEDVYNELSKESDGECPGVWHYEVSNELAPRVFIEMSCPNMDGDASWPDLKDFETFLTAAIKSWMTEREGFSIYQPILPQLDAMTGQAA